MIEIRGNIFEQHDADAICVTTNGVVKDNGELVMGQGTPTAQHLAAKFARKWPLLPAKAGEGVRKHGNHVQYFLDDLFGHTRIVCLPTKEDWKDPSPLWLIERSIKELVDLTNDKGWKKVVLSQPGCGRGGRDWETEVKPILEKYLDDRFYIITP